VRLHLRLAATPLAIAGAIGYGSLALLVLAADASARGRTHAPTVKFIERQDVLAPGAVGSFTARCPRAVPRAVGPEFGPLSNAAVGQLALAGSFPRGPSGWTVQVRNLSALPQEYFVGVTCLRAPGARFAVVRTSAVLDPQTDGVQELRCPASAPSPISSTYQAQPGTVAGSAVVNLTLALSGKKGLLSGRAVAGMRNLTDGPVAVLVGALCTSARASVREGVSTVPAAGHDGVYGDCPRRGQLAVGGEFYAADPNDSSAIVLDGFQVRGPAQWAAGGHNLTARPIPYVESPICIG